MQSGIVDRQVSMVSFIICLFSKHQSMICIVAKRVNYSANGVNDAFVIDWRALVQRVPATSNAVSISSTSTSSTTSTLPYYVERRRSIVQALRHRIILNDIENTLLPIITDSLPCECVFDCVLFYSTFFFHSKIYYYFILFLAWQNALICVSLRSLSTG